MKVFSVDAKTDGLYGPAFAIAATVRQDGREVAAFQGRIFDYLVLDTWARGAVLPVLRGMTVTHSSSELLEEAFWHFWMAHKDGAKCIAHGASPAESGLFRRCVERDLNAREWSGPVFVHEVGTALLLRGENSCSLAEYNHRHGICVPFVGPGYHPMYNAVSAALVWEHAAAATRVTPVPAAQTATSEESVPQAVIETPPGMVASRKTLVVSARSGEELMEGIRSVRWLYPHLVFEGVSALSGRVYGPPIHQLRAACGCAGLSWEPQYIQLPGRAH